MGVFKKVSLKDIAKAAGVSTALVSFVLNGKSARYRVNEETAKRVLKKARELDYRPHSSSKGLRYGLSKTIGVVLSDIANPFFSQVARVMENEAAKLGYTVLFGSSDENAGLMNSVVNSLMNKGVDGLVIVPCEHAEEAIGGLVQNRVPVVLFDRSIPSIPTSYVMLNNHAAAYAATKRLLAVGKKPYLVAYDIRLNHIEERIRGYQDAMANAGKSKQARVLYLDRSDLQMSAQSLLTESIEEEECDAFLFATNKITLTCLYAFKRMGHEVFDRLKLAGFDATPAFDFFPTPIDRISQPVEQMVKKALEIVITYIHQEDVSLKKVMLEGKYVESPGGAR
ncbi:MAG: LacI family DNA-binding transcriptional regulator [Mediterranea sp.]|jgi:LacI family transcriptional regulator|nr:LacI family DNA-binding transcriptional regulator [Mediterranea sp.]